MRVATNYPAEKFPFSVAVGDFNGDGKPDLVVANHDSTNVSLLLGNRDGTFQAAVSYVVGAGSTSVAVADFNGDGKPDLAGKNRNRPAEPRNRTCGFVHPEISIDF